MQPSKAIFSKQIALDSNQMDRLIINCFDEVYSPKHTLEELIAELEATLQSKLSQDPGAYLSKDLPESLNPSRVTLKIDQPDQTHLLGRYKTQG